MVEDVAGPDGLVVLHKALGAGGEVVVPDGADSRQDTGYQHDQQHHGNYAGAPAALLLVGRGALESEELGHDEACQRDEEAVDEEEVRRAEDVGGVERGDAVADGA